MARLTAKEARELAGPTLDEKIDSLLAAIGTAAANEKRQLRTGWEYKEHPELWINGGYSRTSEYRRAEEILKKLGYDVSFYYNEGQFVDMYTIIKW